MASSGMEVRWAEPGLGKGPRRRRWAWPEGENDAVGSVPHSWREEGPFRTATSPELLEDFHRAQRNLQPLEWNLEPQAEGHQASESGEPAEEEFEAGDVDSPESSHLPLSWLPQQDPPPDMTEEEPDEALRDHEAEEAEEGSPRLGYETGLCSGDHGNSSPMALGWGQAIGWVAPGKQASGDRLPELSEANPTVDLSSARSWSSGTVSLGHHSDSLDSSWEGETHVAQPTALAEALPQSPSHHLLNSEDRTGRSVALATPTEFQDSSAPPAQSPQCPEDRWRGEITSLSCPRPGDQAWKRTRTSPKALPSRFTGSVSPPNPQPRSARQERPPPSRGATVAGHSSSDAPKYGRGRLNYPLPDFSKVGPRVRFPRDESYRPPKARSRSKQPQDPGRPLIFKSPAEIVQEVLLSSEEACSGKAPPPTHPFTRVPQEFQTPEQATKLVHQLQEDYHKLLTKYAEAENTIDQLCLGAKVNLYSDPPQPSHSIRTGMAPQGTKVLSFTIPQPHSVERWLGPSEALQASETSGWSSARGDPSPSSPSSAPTPGWLLENPGIAQDQPSAERTQVLASQATRLLAKVESFAGLMQAGQLTPQDQLKGFQWLKAAHSALEGESLKACGGQHLTQQPAGSEEMPGKFDPGRELEAEILQLGIRLEELKSHMEQNQQEPERAGSDSPLGSPPASPFAHRPTDPSSPSRQAYVPAIQTFCLEPDAPGTDPCASHVNVEVSPAGSEAEDRPLGLPSRLRHKELQAEQDFHGLLERYLSVKSLPEAVSAEEEEEEEQGRTLTVDGTAPAPGTAPTSKFSSRQLPVQAERDHRTPLEETVEQTVSRKPAGFHAPMARHGPLLDLGKAEAAPLGPGRPPRSRGTKPPASHQSSLTSLEGSGVSERLPQKPLRQTAGPPLEESWLASPETDSGFVGSETSRVSPLTQTPEHRLSCSRTPGMLGQRFSASVPRDAASHPQTRGLPVPRRATEPRTPRSRAQRHPSTRDSPLQRRAPSFCLEPVMAAGVAVPGAQLEGRKQIPEQPHPSTRVSPPSALAPAAAALPRGPTETTPGLLTRTGRDQAIRELQEEVSRLQLQLEDSLHQLPQDSPTRPASTFDRPARARVRPADSLTSWGSRYGSKSTERLSIEPGAAEQAVPPGRRRARSSSVPREVSRLTLSSESEPTSPRLSSEKGRTTKDGPRATRDKTRGMRGTDRPDRVTFRGQYTGQEYHVLTPKIVPRGSSRVSCPHCQPVRTQDPGAVPRDPLGPSPTDAPRCPLCGGFGSVPEGEAPDSATSGAEKSTTRRNAPSTSSPKARTKWARSLLRPPPGLWYLAAAPSVPAPPAFAYVSSVPVMPYPSATVFYAPPGGPTSTPSTQLAAERHPAASSPPAGGHQHSVPLDLEDLEELNKALNRAVQAAKRVRSTAKHMNRSLSADLRQTDSPRGSCLF